MVKLYVSQKCALYAIQKSVLLWTMLLNELLVLRSHLERDGNSHKHLETITDAAGLRES